MSRLHQIIIRPVMTEKTTQLDEHNKVVFRVAKSATKPEIRTAVEKLFGVKVTSVNTANMPGKPKRFGKVIAHRSGYKKAIVTLAEGETLDFFAIDEFDEDVEAEGTE